MSFRWTLNKCYIFTKILLIWTFTFMHFHSIGDHLSRLSRIFGHFLFYTLLLHFLHVTHHLFRYFLQLKLQEEHLAMLYQLTTTTITTIKHSKRYLHIKSVSIKKHKNYVIHTLVPTKSLAVVVQKIFALPFISNNQMQYIYYWY